MFETVTLSNGVRIVMERIPFIRSIAFGIWVMNGSRNETPKTSGISHFIEHMLFKGTFDRSAKDIADEMDIIGGQINAFTSKEYTSYYFRTLDSHFSAALDVLADMFFNSKFDNSDIEKELNVIIEEINMYEDTPEELVHEIMHFSVFPKDPLGFSILGTEDSISLFDDHTMKKFYKENYYPENTVIAIAGNFEISDIVKQVEKYFGSFNKSSAVRNSKYCAEYVPSVITKEKDIEQVHLALGFPGIKIGTDESYTLAALNTIFGGGMSSRLFQKIREDNGLVYSVYSSNVSYMDTGLFTIYAGLNRAQTEQVFNLIIDEINGLQADKITEKQLTNAKEQIKSNYLLSLESSSNRMNSIGRTMLLLDKVIPPDELIKKVEAINIEGIYGLIPRLFDFSRMSLSAVGNIRGIDFGRLIENAK